MTQPRMSALTVIFAVSVLAATSTAAAAPPGGSLNGLELFGECSGGVKSVVVKPRTPFLFAPLRLLDTQNKPTGKWLFPVTVYAEGEGLKARHLTPGVTYVRPGRAPKAAQVTCSLYGKTADGDIRLEIAGPILP